MCKNMTIISKDYLVHIIDSTFTLIFESIKTKIVHTM